MLKGSRGQSSTPINTLEGIVKLTDCRLFSAFLSEGKPSKLRRAAIGDLLRFRSESG